MSAVVDRTHDEPVGKVKPSFGILGFGLPPPTGQFTVMNSKQMIFDFQLSGSTALLNFAHS